MEMDFEKFQEVLGGIVEDESERYNFSMSTHRCVNLLARMLKLANKEKEILDTQIQEEKILTVENYPHLSYPIYIYYLFRYIVMRDNVKLST